ncbi:MAG: hypothetical protein ACOYMU_08935 [Phycisphaerales bacterium]|jgi:hypothetical protein
MRKTHTLLTATLSCFLVGGSTASAFFSLFEQNAQPTAPVNPPVTPPATPPATPPVTTDKTTDKASEGTKTPATKTTAAKTPAKTPAAKTPAAKPPVQEKKKADAAKEATETPATNPAPATTPEADIPPEMVKYAKMAKSGKFKEFTRLAAERQALYVKSSALRMELRGAEASQAQLDAVAKVQAEIGKMGDRMDTFSSGKEWTQDDYVTMDYIVSEQMRLNPIK